MNVLSRVALVFWIGIVAARSSEARNDYQIGAEWGKVPVTLQQMANETPAFQRAVKVTANVRGATGFYLGRFSGAHVLATNHHVCPNGFSCLGYSVTFPFLNGGNAVMKKLLGTFPEIDLALLVVEIKDSNLEKELLTLGRNFAFDLPLRHGQELLTIGFGVQSNPSRVMVAGQDSDCKVFSDDGEYRLLSDPDTANPASYQAWSFATGCDGSHGDSGSSMVDRRTGDLVGILWTGRVPKDQRIQDPRFVDEVFRSRSAQIWTELTYAVPAPKIREMLLLRIKEPRFPAESQAILKALLQIQ